MYKNENVEWYISKGDLVKVEIWSTTGWGRNEVTHEYGIVIGEPKNSQITLFPEVNVYLLKEKRIQTFQAGSLEIISTSNNFNRT